MNRKSTGRLRYVVEIIMKSLLQELFRSQKYAIYMEAGKIYSLPLECNMNGVDFQGYISKVSGDHHLTV